MKSTKQITLSLVMLAIIAHSAAAQAAPAQTAYISPGVMAWVMAWWAGTR